MFKSNLNEELTKGAIKKRMVKHAAREWGVDEREVEDGFDPIVEMLMGGCAKELEKITHELYASEARVLSRLAALMTPDVWTGPKAAHAIIHARSVEPIYYTQSFDQLFLKKIVPSQRNVQQEFQSIFFSPAGTFKTWDGDIQMIATQKSVAQLQNTSKKTLLKISGNKEQHHVLWLGVEMNEEIAFLKNLSIFFDWINIPPAQKKRYYNLLPFTRWSFNGQPLNSKVGYTYAAEAENEAIEEQAQNEAAPTINPLSAFEEAYNISANQEKKVRAVYEKYFITLENVNLTGVDDRNPQHNAFVKKYPSEFEQIWTEDELKVFKDELLWFKVEFPNDCQPETLESLFCVLNCFPIINRELHTKVDKIAKGDNIIPFTQAEALTDAGNYFLDVASVTDSDGDFYQHPNPLRTIGAKQKSIRSYALRQGGVGRFDIRNAHEMLDYFLDLLKDESHAFAALERNWLNKEIKTIKETINRINDKISMRYEQEKTAYLILETDKYESNVHIQYWTANGNFANNIPKDTPLDLDSGIVFQKNSIVLATRTYGGVNKLKAKERLKAYKKAVLSRGRVVTAEDIKVVCYEHLGEQVAQIVIKNGVQVSTELYKGLVRTIDIHIQPAVKSDFNKQEWQMATDELKLMLEDMSTFVYPFRIKMQ